MKSTRVYLFLLLILGLATGLQAQATRTWVSGVGDDANPCSRTAPCKTFAGAISKTATNGIINVIDSGGFGTVNITKSITIDATPFMGGVLAAGVNGVIVNNAAAVVILRGLDIEGANSGTNGVSVLAAAKVLIERCNIFGFNSAAPNGNGISINTTGVVNVVVRDTTISNNSNNGIRATTSSIINKIHLDNTRVEMNGANGVDFLNNFQATFNHSTIAQNISSGVLFEGTNSSLDAFGSAFEGNSTGLTTNAGSQVKIHECQIVHNTTSISSTTGVVTHGSNAITDNQVNNLPSSSVAPAAANGQQ
jgi:hypothetical protein